MVDEDGGSSDGAEPCRQTCGVYRAALNAGSWVIAVVESDSSVRGLVLSMTASYMSNLVRCSPLGIVDHFRVRGNMAVGHFATALFPVGLSRLSTALG